MRKLITVARHKARPVVSRAIAVSAAVALPGYAAVNEPARMSRPVARVLLVAAVALCAFVTFGGLANAATIRTIAGNGGVEPQLDGGPASGDGGLATDAEVLPRSVAELPDGSVIFADGRNRIRRVGTDGVISTIVVRGLLPSGYPGNTGDGGPATAAYIGSAMGIAPLPYGGFIFADNFNNVVR